MQPLKIDGRKRYKTGTKKGQIKSKETAHRDTAEKKKKTASTPMVKIPRQQKSTLKRVNLVPKRDKNNKKSKSSQRREKQTKIVVQKPLSRTEVESQLRSKIEKANKAKNNYLSKKKKMIVIITIAIIATAGLGYLIYSLAKGAPPPKNTTDNTTKNTTNNTGLIIGVVIGIVFVIGLLFALYRWQMKKAKIEVDETEIEFEESFNSWYNTQSLLAKTPEEKENLLMYKTLIESSSIQPDLTKSLLEMAKNGNQLDPISNIEKAQEVYKEMTKTLQGKVVEFDAEKFKLKLIENTYLEYDNIMDQSSEKIKGAQNLKQRFKNWIGTKAEEKKIEALSERLRKFGITPLTPEERIESRMKESQEKLEKLGEKVSFFENLKKEPQSNFIGFDKYKKESNNERIALKGPAGTGKSTLAESIAAQNGRKFYSVDATTITNPLLGQTGVLYQQFFDFLEAKNLAGEQITVFFDELDQYNDEAKNSIQLNLEKASLKNVQFIMATNQGYEKINGEISKPLMSRFRTQLEVLFGKEDAANTIREHVLKDLENLNQSLNKAESDKIKKDIENIARTNIENGRQALEKAKDYVKGFLEKKSQNVEEKNKSEK